MKKVVAITVSYHPEAAVFGMLLERLLVQVPLVIVVDNTPGDENPILFSILAAQINRERCQILRMKENTGIAHAINIGLQGALSEGADFVLLSDQDSLPAYGMVENLCRAYAELKDKGMRVGAVGPTFFDLNTSLNFPFQVNLPGRFLYGHKTATVDDPHVEALSLITSGSLIPRDAIKEVGPMREDFFIDHVDIEWCHRARSKGYQLFGTAWAVLYQRMGDARLPIWFFGWRYESAYGPVRIYYRVRNFFALCDLEFVDPRWKIRNAMYWVKVCLAHVVFGSRRLETIAMIGKGIWHGLSKRMGPYKEG